MSDRPFHHGNLRATLLAEATTMLRESGVDALSLRELARRAGVSHGAPRSHFVDRQALLDALAVDGFDRLTGEIHGALARQGTLRDRFLGMARAYVDFAIDDAALIELMFQVKTAGRPGPVHDAAARLFAEMGGALPTPGAGAAGTRTPDPAESRETFKLLVAATLQGIAALVATRRLTRARGARLIDEAVDMLMASGQVRGVLDQAAPRPE